MGFARSQERRRWMRRRFTQSALRWRASWRRQAIRCAWYSAWIRARADHGSHRPSSAVCAKVARGPSSRASLQRRRLRSSRRNMASARAWSFPLRTIPGATTASRSSAATASNWPMRWSWPMEDEILHQASQIAAPDPASLPAIEDNAALQADYIQFLIDCVPGTQPGRIAHRGRLRQWSRRSRLPPALSPVGTVEVTLLNIAPDGRNINVNCGASASPAMSPPR